MPIKVRYQNDPSQDCTIRPTPFISISEAVLKSKEGNFGVTYTITLTGTLLVDRGTPYALNPDGTGPFSFPWSPTPSPLIGPYGLFDSVPLSADPNYKPPRQQVEDKRASAMLSKQRALRALFARDGQRVQLTDIFDDSGSTIVCFPRVQSIDFTENAYVTKCEYTIVLEADYLLRGTFDDDQLYVDEEGTLASKGSTVGPQVTISGLLSSPDTSFIESYSDEWNLEAEDGQGESIDNPRSYRISHSISAVGKATYGWRGEALYKPAWEHARNFVQSRLSDNPNTSYPNVIGQLGSGTLNLINSYGGYNQIRTEQINVADGAYSVTENWILTSGLSTESYNITTSTSNSDAFINVSIDGAIKGMSRISSDKYGDPELTAISGAYANALNKYNAISNSGSFGLTSDIFKRVNNMVAVELNSQPVSLSIGTNQFAGEISYNLAFNNRPTNIISGAIAESIQVNDTYPGDVFALINVIGRPTGPILQYIGGRTEYKRDVSVNLTMDYTKIPYGSQRNTLLLKKPSLVEPTASQIAGLIAELSPQGEPGVRKYFVSPPTESWSPKEGTYSFNISWTYEVDR
jgi:hypothetical protein